MRNLCWLCVRRSSILFERTSLLEAAVPSCDLAIKPFVGEPRVRDLDLAEELGFSEPRWIRKLIKRYEADLERLGVCATVSQTSGSLGGRPATEFWLNKKQALFIIAKSETSLAVDITIKVIEKFDAYERGLISNAPAVAALPDFNDPAEAALPIVHVKDGTVFANSRDVAAYFGKRHDHVLDKINKIWLRAPHRGLPNFRETPMTNFQNGQEYRTFDMTKDGFTFLVMGFTGAEAEGFKWKYIDRFNEMEECLRNPPAVPALPAVPSAALPVVHIKDGKVFANSRDVAAYSGKLHKDVLRDIDQTLENIHDANLRSGPYC